MKISKEVRIGILVSISILIFFVGFNFLRNADFLSNEKEYYCFYSNVDGLLNSANVQIRGLNVGRVTAMKLVDGKGVKVTISVSKSINVPQGTVANLESLDLLGTKAIRLDLGSSPEMLPNGAQLVTNKEGGLMDNMSAELTPRLRELKGTISAFDSTLASVNKIVGEDNQRALAEAIASFKLTADNLAKLSGTLAEESGEIKNILHNANSITGNLAKQNDTIQRILTNVNNLTRQLANAPIQQTLADLQKASGQIQGVIGKINNNEGTLGMLINNKDVYNNLNSSLGSLNSLMKDINAHPSRYINVTIFGSSKKKN